MSTKRSLHIGSARCGCCEKVRRGRVAERDVAVRGKRAADGEIAVAVDGGCRFAAEVGDAEVGQ